MCSWFHSRIWDARFHLFVLDVIQGDEGMGLDVNQGDEEVGWIQDFFAWPKESKDIPYILRELLKIEDMLWNWGVGVCAWIVKYV